MYCCSSNMVYKQIKMDMVSFNNFNLGKSSCCTRNLFPHRSYDRSTCDACHHHDARSLLLHLHCSARLRPRMWIPRVCSLSTSKRPPPQYHCLQSRHRLCLFCSTPPRQSLSWRSRWQKLDGCLFSCPEQLNRWPCHSLTHSLTQSQYFYFWHTKNDPRDLWPLRHLIRVMRGHELTEKDLPTYLQGVF